MRAESDGGAGLIHCPPIVPQAISSKWAKGSSGPAGDEVANLVATVAGTLASSGGHAYPGTCAQDVDQGFLIPEVAHSIRADGFDASEGGTGRGTPLVPVPIQNATRGKDQNGLGIGGDVMFTLDQGSQHGVAVPVGVDVYNGVITGQIAATMGTRGSSDNATGPQVLAFSCKDHGADAGDIAPTLRSMGHDGSHANGGGQVAVAFDSRQDCVSSTEHFGALGASSPQAQAVAFKAGAGAKAGGVGASNEVAPTLGASGSGNQGSPALQQGMQVRRLTPRECERLQGVPDDWTLVPNAKGKPMADGPRYKMIGNAFAEPCIRWIGMRIEAATRESLARARSEACA
jgi:DNA (cytosine-5)-methyltransferase 1